jgi:hypothetical protein
MATVFDLLRVLGQDGDKCGEEGIGEKVSFDTLRTLLEIDSRLSPDLPFGARFECVCEGLASSTLSRNSIGFILENLYEIDGRSALFFPREEDRSMATAPKDIAKQLGVVPVCCSRTTCVACDAALPDEGILASYDKLKGDGKRRSTVTEERQGALLASFTYGAHVTVDEYYIIYSTLRNAFATIIVRGSYEHRYITMLVQPSYNDRTRVVRSSFILKKFTSLLIAFPMIVRGSYKHR